MVSNQTLPLRQMMLQLNVMDAVRVMNQNEIWLGDTMGISVVDAMKVGTI